MYSLHSIVLVLVWTLQFMFRIGHCQQAYINNEQLDCPIHYKSTYGHVCNGATTSCLSYLTFRSNPPYDSAATIAYLLHARATLIARINNVSDVERIPKDTVVIVPVFCSCSGQYYQHNATYAYKEGETYFTIANDTYQGLTSCQAMMAQNPRFDERDLQEGNHFTVPLRCACPTTNQTAVGIKYLLTYLVGWYDSDSTIADMFQVDRQALVDANQLSLDPTIYPFTTFLVPLNATPSMIQAGVSVSPPPFPPPPALIVVNIPNSSSSKKWVYMSVGGGAGFILFVLCGIAAWFLYRGRAPQKTTQSPACSTIQPEKKLNPVVESLLLYKFEELQNATAFFSEANKIKGSVYRGSFQGENAAIKIMKGDVSTEINILKQINHTNIIRLSGFCVHKGNTYLVYEYAENGCLSDWLHNSQNSPLGWKQRIQIAYCVADALNYLHNYTTPPYIHKNLSSSNILLDGNMRAKVANFGLARNVENQERGRMQLTRHVVGTQGYMAPEYIEDGVITPQLDVFALGVVILELLSGRKAVTFEGDMKEREELCVSMGKVLEGENAKDKLRQFLDPSLRLQYPLDLVFSMAQLANACVAQDLNLRPTSSEAFMTLSKILSSTLNWDSFDEIELVRSL